MSVVPLCGTVSGILCKGMRREFIKHCPTSYYASYYLLRYPAPLFTVTFPRDSWNDIEEEISVMLDRGAN